jgi:hypothetical protein
MNSTQKEPTPKLARPNALHKKQMETDEENPKLGLPNNTSLRSTSTEQYRQRRLTSRKTTTTA